MEEAHGVTASTRVTSGAATQVARVMAGLGTASRVQILGRLREGSCSVGELCTSVGMAQPAVSHQLRVLRDLNLVVGVRTGRQTVYGLYDPHVAVLLDEALRHIEHLRAGVPELPNLGSHTEQPNHDWRAMSDEQTHGTPHTHEHEHGDETHVHAHTTHEHEHVKHEHQHSHDGESHTHPHVHEEGVEGVHEHKH